MTIGTVGSWQIEMARPLWLASLAVLPLLLLYWRRSLVQFSPRKQLMLLALRTFAVVALIVGLTGLKATAPGSQPSIVASWTRAESPVPPLATLTGPDQAPAGEPFSLDLHVRAGGKEDASIQLLRGAEVILSKQATLTEGVNTIRLPVVGKEAGRAVFTARIESSKSSSASRLTSTSACWAMTIGPRPRVLLIESRQVLSESLAKALQGENVVVDVRTPQQLPARREELSGYGLVILSNVPAADLQEGRMEALRDFVRQFGGGLVVVGGDQSFTAGRYRGTVLEEILPVISEERKSKPKPTLAMALVMDCSGSMEGRSLDLAKEALRRAVGLLGPQDQVGVLVFADTSRWVTPIRPATEKEEILAQIATIKAEGSTNMYPALEQAFLALRESDADLKHIIVMTDGVCTPGDFDEQVRRIAAGGITMSTVGVGSEPVRPFLQGIADKAKGRAHFCEDPKDVPRVFEMDTGVAAKIGITEEPFSPRVVHATQALRGLDLAKAPRLLGYVETQTRPQAHVVLAAPTGEPILALWRSGRGAVAAFTSDVLPSRWAAPWLQGWRQGFDRFWVQLVRQTLRREAAKASRVQVRVAGNQMLVTLDAAGTDGRWMNGAEVRVALAGSRQSASPMTLTPIAPGRYAGFLPLAGPGEYWIDGEIVREGKVVEKVSCGTVVTETDLGGDPRRFEPRPAENFMPAEASVPRTCFFWPWLLTIAAIVFVGDLALKRGCR